MELNHLELRDAILNKSNTKNIQYNDFLVEGIFYNNLINFDKPYSKNEFDKDINYNSHGYRSPEFTNNVDFLFSGCSMTFGTGMDIDNLWHEMLIKKIGGSHASVAYPGDSIAGQVLRIFAYIKKFGNPKHIICLFPNFDRFLMYNNKNNLVSSIFTRYYREDEYTEMIVKEKNIINKMKYFSKIFKSSCNIYDTEQRNSYLKKPVIASEIITQELYYMYSSQFIHILSQYCDVAGIKFIWSTWDKSSSQIINVVKNDLFFNNYVQMDYDWDLDVELQTEHYIVNNNVIHCHSEFKMHPEFHLASDRENGSGRPHHGLHRQLHYYEKFLNKLGGLAI